MIKLKALFFTGIILLNSAYSSAQNCTQYKSFADDWVATDALGRTLPEFYQTGGLCEGKIVGVFYYIWQGYHGNRVLDITKILDQYPQTPLSNKNPGWGNIGEFHFWGEPEQGYYRSNDPWVIRRDLQMLSNANVDFIFFDVTNGYTYLETVITLCEISLQMRNDGIATPQITFITNSSSAKVVQELYDKFYSINRFTELWFQWEGKPLIMCDFNDSTLRSEVKEFFTMKYSWAWTNTEKEANHWQWLDKYPQNWGWSKSPAIPEQISVSAAHHPQNPLGNSFNQDNQPSVNEKYLTGSTGHGLQFAEQWDRALNIDPEVIMITQWNEWIAQRCIWENGNSQYAGRPIQNGDSWFVDVFTEEFNRDIAPMKDGHTDNLYYQMISNIRKFKGMNKPQPVSTPKKIVIDGLFSEWDDVSPAFWDPSGDAMHRNFPGYDTTTVMINNSGRNDIIESRVNVNDDTIYFMVKTKKDLTPNTDSSWMYLLLDTDRSKSTGWEGYDYLVNHEVLSSHETTLKQWNGTEWTNPVKISYSFQGSSLELSISAKSIGFITGEPEIYFKWADNTGSLENISDFFIQGDAAPDRRFNFYFGKSLY